MEEYEHLNGKYGSITISTPKSERRDFDDALDYLVGLGYKLSEAVRASVELYAKDCGFVPRGKEE